MSALTDLIYAGSNAVAGLTEGAVNDAIAKHGADTPVAFPDTAYFFPTIYAATGVKVKTLGDLPACVGVLKSLITNQDDIAQALNAGLATAVGAEIIEGLKYVGGGDPYAEDSGIGFVPDPIIRSLGVPLVTGDIPGFVVIIGPAPSTEEAIETIKGYQSRGIFVFLIGGIIEQAVEAGLSMGFPVRVVPVGEEIWSVGHVISLVVRAAMIFGNVQPGDCDGFHKYTFDRINAFVNAYKPVPDITVACGAGAIKLGFPVITNDHDDMWAVPKSLIIYDDTKDWIDTSIEARGIKLKITKIDIPVSFSSAFEGEIIRKGDMQIEVDGSRKDCFELVSTKEASEVEDHKIEVVGPEIDEFPAGSKISLSYTVEVAGKSMQPDFEPVFERKIHQFLNCVEGVMHTGQRDMIRIRISKADYEAGFKFRHIGEVLYAKIKSEFDTVVDKCQVKIVVGDEANAELRKHANEIFDKRDERLKSMTDESVPVFYSCIMCQAFSPSHVCIVTPERLGLCGAVSWLDAKATNELDPQGPCQVVTKERCIDERTGRYEDVDEAVAEYSHGALEHVTLYSLLEDPMTSCGCFECICGIEPVSMGVVITCREFAGMTPLGMTFSEMASMTGGGVQTPGFMGHGKHYIASHKFLKAEGGLGRLVWLPKDLKDQIRDKMNETAKDLYGIENFADMVADETTCASGDPEELLNFLTEKGHPVLSMEPFDM